MRDDAHRRFGAERTPAPPKTAGLAIAFLRAELMRHAWEEAVEQDRDQLEVWAYLSLWFASLYVVVEGWESAYEHNGRLLDERIHNLLKSPHTESLRLLRNKIFHVDAFDHQKVKEFMAGGYARVEWAEQLSREFHRVFEIHLGQVD